MAARSLTATPQGLDIATKVLTGKGWNKDNLAEHVIIHGKNNKTTEGIGIATVKKFFSGQAVDRKYFVGICNALALDWEKISGLKSVEPVADSAQPATDIDALVQEIRQKVNADIHNRCGTMRVLDMEQPIGIGDIYTSVNILEKLSGRRRLAIDELLQGCDLKNFDRLMLGQIHHERVPGLEAVERYDKLMILGKPGAGKTTFMKRMATLCNQGEFQTGRIPVFVTLKEFAEAPGKPDLSAYIAKQWKTCGVKETKSLTATFGQGRALVLLDGLDEVREEDHDRTLQNIKDFTHQFRDCQFVMTCRIAAREYTFQQFTEVEVADFNPEQIAEFATKWFKTKKDPEKGENFIKRLDDNKPIQELATNPLLLTLLCLVFGEAADFPANRSELYKEGLDVLLKKWDAKRNIERDQVYKKLSLKRKEDLLSHLAFQTFERGDYFFKQKVVEQQIIDYIRNLPGANEDEEALQLDSEAVLKSIEAQHGLLVERARGIYSFSHLTFQEYFTAKQITSPTAQLSLALENLATHITEKRYCEIFLLAVGMLPEADDLLKLMKQQMNQLIGNDSKLQAFLVWVDEKSQLVEVSYKLVGVRLVYLLSVLNLNSILNLDLNLDFDLALDLALTFVLDRALVIDLEGLLEEDTFEQAFEIDFAFDQVLGKTDPDDLELTFKLEALKAQMPDPSDCEWEALCLWWNESKKHWITQLRLVMIEHRNIGYDWQFTDAQKEKLRQYYDTYILLTDCLNSDCYVTKATRQEIEETLLLPISQIDG